MTQRGGGNAVACPASRGCPNLTPRRCSFVGCDLSQAKREGCAATWRFRHFYRAPMRGGNLGDDRESKARARPLGRTSAPEPLENARLVLIGNSRSVVGDGDRSFR